MTDYSFSRRNLLALAGVGVVLPKSGAAQADELAHLNPLGPLGNYDKLKGQLFDSVRAKSLVSQLWDAYNRTKQQRFAEWACVYAYCWWRTGSNREERIKSAKVAQKMAAKLAEDFPDSAAGHQWLAIHTGTEVLSVGVVDALHAIPAVRKSLERAMAIDPRYFYGLPTLILAKVYQKLPQFPVSIGDLDHAMALLDQVRPLQEKKFAVWYLFLAEVVYLKTGAEAAIKVLDQVKDVVPVDSATAYLKDATLNDAQTLRIKFASDSYERYIWDPLLEVAKPGKA